MTFHESLSESIRERFCDALGTINNFNDWFERLPFGASNLTTGIARNAYRNLCNREPPNEPPPPFTGGQCPKRYYVAVDVQYDGDSAAGVQLENSGTIGNLIWGPITGFNIVNSGSSSKLFVSCRGNGPFPSGSTSLQLYSVGYNGSNIMGIQSYNILALTPYDGSPDDCGDPPPIIPPPTPDYNTGNTTITYNDYSDNSVDVDVDFTFGSPVINIDGDLTIPVRINVEGSDIDIGGSFSVNNPEFNFNFGDQNYSPNDSSNGSDYDSPNDTPEPPADVPAPVLPTNPSEPDVETRRTIRGAIVTVTEYPSDFGVLYQDGNPDIALPNFGYISFFCQIGSRAAWTIDLPVKNRRNLIECPWVGGAIAVEGTARPGVSWVISEVYELAEDTVSFEV